MTELFPEKLNLSHIRGYHRFIRQNEKMSSRDPDREKIRESPVLSPRVLQAYRSPLKSFSSPPSSAKSGKSDDTDPERQPKSPSRLRSLYDPHSAEDPNNEDPWAHAMRLFTESSGGWIQAIRRGQVKWIPSPSDCFHLNSHLEKIAFIFGRSFLVCHFPCRQCFSCSDDCVRICHERFGNNERTL